MPDTDSIATRSELSTLVSRVLGLQRPGQRMILGIAGGPGSGKTTMALGLVQAINALSVARGGAQHLAVHLPMDGFHLANATLDRLGSHNRKGAIDTFDAWGFTALLQRLLVEVDHIVYAPSFRREVDEGVAGEIAVLPESRIVITEGNYLLVDEEPWRATARLATEIWFCETTDTERMRRLIDRHERHGSSAEAAEAWARTVDGVNARLVDDSRHRAALVISGEGGVSHSQPG
ncbi:nucleoside/nucleotide kinase family protein [Cryobacterium frigoriphilum]|uniref:Nucleoside/nucleotide kinase family protein n=1 Tax=Cryobacterium frigoriphilum TaxID=1259150 RepID=A0A4R8ZZR6_9MICO|nr:nucleoside/nucleotide kinase family protein [Cryobacterium frigoriphilum]TFD49642.1 nucleoside/nucleotide kinase family protein [Cryobacterium frigoriphilum]